MGDDRRARAAPWLCAGVLGSVALLVALFSLSSISSWQAGVAPDGMSYLGAASNLHEGRGLTGPFATAVDPFSPAEAAAFDGAVPFIQWPPLYPAALALMSPGDVDPQIAAGLFNAVTFGLLVAVVGGISARLSGSTSAGILAGLVLAAQPELLLLRLLVASEPLFLVLVTTATWCLVRRLAGGSTRWLVAAFALAGAAALTRYAGLPVVGGMALAVVLWDRGPVRRRSLRAAAGLAAALPAFAWSQWTAAAAGVPTRQLVVQLPDEAQWRFMVDSALGWVSPPDASSVARAVVVTAVVGLVLAAVVASQRRRATRAAEGDRPNADVAAVDEFTAWVRVSALIVPVYMAGVVATHALFDRGVPIGGRLMVPVLPLLLPSIAVGVVRLIEQVGPRWRRLVAAGAVATAVAVIVPVGSVLWDVLDRATVDRAAEQTSTTVYLRSLPDDALVLSNDPAYVWFTSRLQAVPAPRRSYATTGLANDEFEAHLAKSEALLDDRGGAVVLYRTATLFAPHFARVEDFEARGFVVVEDGDDAVVLERPSSW